MRNVKNFTTALTAATLAAAPALAEDYSLQNAFPKGLAMLGPSADYFAELVSIGTAGEIDFTHYGAGELSPPEEIVDNVGIGAIDAGWSFAPYTAGKVPAVQLFGSIPFGPDAQKYMAWLHQGGGLDIWQEAYAPFNVVPMPCGATLPEAGGWFTREINTPEDFEGLRMRIGGIGGKVMAKLGASAQSLPTGEIYTSLETGRLDATEFSFPEIDKLLGFQNIVENYYFPGWHQPAGLIELTINQDLWDSWTDGQKTIIENACRATTAHFLEVHAANQPAILEEFEAAGVQIRRFPDAVIEALRDATLTVMAEESAADPLFEMAWNSYTEFSDSYDTYQALNMTE